MKIITKKYTVENENKGSELEKMDKIIDYSDRFLRQFSINRYVETKLNQLEIDDFKEWYKNEELSLNENFWNFSSVNVETLLKVSESLFKEFKESVNKDVVSKLEISETEEFKELECISLLVHIYLNESGEEFIKRLNEITGEEFESFIDCMYGFTIAKPFMPIGDQMPLPAFLEVYRCLLARKYTLENIEKLKAGTNQLTLINDFM